MKVFLGLIGVFMCGSACACQSFDECMEKSISVQKAYWDNDAGLRSDISANQYIARANAYAIRELAEAQRNCKESQ